MDTLYVKNATASGSNFLSLQDGGSAPATSVTGTGWTVGTVPAGNYARMAAGVERAAATFGSTAQPSSGPDNTLGDCFRSENKLSGGFAAGAWQLALSVKAVTSGGDQDGRAEFRLWKGVAADGSDAVEFGGGILEGSAATDVNPSTGVYSIATFSLSEVVFSNEYLFVQVAWKITGAGGSSTRDVLIETGGQDDSGVNSGVFGTPFSTHPVTLITQSFQGISGRRYGSFDGKLRTASSTLTMHSMTLAASASFSPGVHVAMGSLLSHSITLAATATFASGTHTATGSLTTQPEILSGAVTFGGGTKHVDAALSTSHQVIAGSVSFASGGVHVLSAALSLNSETLAATATSSAGVHTATGALLSHSITISGTATYTSAGPHTASGTLIASSMTLSAASLGSVIQAPIIVAMGWYIPTVVQGHYNP